MRKTLVVGRTEVVVVEGNSGGVTVVVGSVICAMPVIPVLLWTQRLSHGFCVTVSGFFSNCWLLTDFLKFPDHLLTGHDDSPPLLPHSSLLPIVVVDASVADVVVVVDDSVTLAAVVVVDSMVVGGKWGSWVTLRESWQQM